jgi:spore germination protein D
MCAWLIICMLTSLLTACGSDQGSSSAQSTGGYKESKSMIIDVLKSDEGKKAIYEALTAGPTQSSSPSSSSQSGDSESEGGQQGGGGGNGGGSGGSMGIKMLLPSQTSEDVRIAVKETITSPEYKKEIEKIMTDPQFAGDFAKAISAQSKEMHLQLIKDPTYQKSVGDIMKSPDVMKMFLELTKTPDYRKQSMTVMQEAMQSPLFKLQVMELLKTVVQQQLQPTIEKAPGAGGGKGGGEGSGGESKDSGGEEGGQ